MRKHVPASGLIVIAAACGIGCSEYTPAEPSFDGADPSLRAQAAASVRADAPRGLDAEFAALARDVPGFGGIFYDDAGAVNVYVTRNGQARAMSDADVASRVRAWLGDRERRGAARVGAAHQRFVVREGAYDFPRLAEWHQRMSAAVLALPDVAFTDIAETDNRLRVGITRSGAATRVQRSLAALGIPPEAVKVELTGPIRNLATLRNFVRPTAGGQQIYFQVPPQAFLCTLGFNARQQERRYFVIPSHCTATQGGVEGTTYHQPLPPESFIGTEAFDPEYGDFGGACPPTRRCRLSDAAMARYREGVEIGFGQIMRTSFDDLVVGSLDITEPRFRIIGEVPFPVVGEVLSKVGRSTGWTTGPVVFTCLNVNVSGSNISLFCQDVVIANAQPGDSGAPVFQTVPGLELAALFGMLWGSGAVLTPAGPLPVFLFSAMINMEFELGPLRTF